MEPVRLRKTANGRIFAPKRGKQIATPFGYIPEPGELNLFRPALLPCEYRNEKLVQSKCCGRVKRIWCDRDDVQTDDGRCKECQDA